MPDSCESISPLTIQKRLQGDSAVYDRTSFSNTSIYGQFFDDTLHTFDGLDPIQQYLDSCDNGFDAQTSTSDPFGLTNSNVDSKGPCLQPPQSHSEHSGSLSFAAGFPNSLHVNRRTAIPQQATSGTAVSSHRTLSNPHPLGNQRSAPVLMSDLPATTEESSEAQGALYGPYRSLFSHSDAARDHRHVSTRFGRQPYHLPEDDPSIAQVECNRVYHVGRIYYAMIRADRAEDNPGSIAMKRWVTCAHYKSDTIEAFAHKVFDCLLVQVKEGFRGWHHNDYVDDDRKGEERDQQADCIGRLDNIIDALEREKTICEDVMNSASQIRMFVNAPIAYAARKYQNRLGNSKRGRSDGKDGNPRPARRRKTGSTSTRAQSHAASEHPISRDTSPQTQASDTGAMPYYRPSAPQHYVPSFNPISPSNTRSFHNYPMPPAQVLPAFAPMNPAPTQHHSAISRPLMSPPTHPASQMRRRNMPQTPPVPQVSSAPPATPFYHPFTHSAPPSPNFGDFSTPATSSDIWSPTDAFGNPTVCGPGLIDPLLTAEDDLFNERAWVCGDGLNNGHGFPHNGLPAAHVTLADIERGQQLGLDGSVQDPVREFESLWNSQEGVQPFSFGVREGDLHDI
ncbi:hypothetical protein E8E13_001651 [Curvularia kusanoi]|uniref:Uncharacterized protein n=1 Tax=Curvularia kusanoi TaxID=90978 RepID=A0A9P4W788_CURKU|nr:hypothetical protein E8E13_001651 [Curvularia kusanoi]